MFDYLRRAINNWRDERAHPGETELMRAFRRYSVALGERQAFVARSTADPSVDSTVDEAIDDLRAAGFLADRGVEGVDGGVTWSADELDDWAGDDPDDRADLVAATSARRMSRRPGNRLDDGSNEAIADREDFDARELGR